MVKSKGFGAALSAVVKKISLGAAAAPLFLNVWRCWEQFETIFCLYYQAVPVTPCKKSKKLRPIGPGWPWRPKK